MSGGGGHDHGRSTAPRPTPPTAPDLQAHVARLLASRSSLAEAATELADLVASECSASSVAVWSFTDRDPELLAVRPSVRDGNGPVPPAGRSFVSIDVVGVPCRSIPIRDAGLWADDLAASLEHGVEREIGVRFGGVGDGMGALIVHDAAEDGSTLVALDAVAEHVTGFLARVDAAETLRSCVESYHVLFKRAAATALLTNDERLRYMLDSLVLFALVTDASGDVTFMNRALLDRLGCTLDEVVGHGLFAEGPAHDEVKRTISSAIESEQLAPEWINDLALLDGTVMTVRWTSTFIRDGAGRIHALTSVGEDITGSEITRADVTGDRASDERLAESTRMESVGRIAGGIAHDFNNFLAVIGGHTDLARAAPGLSADVSPHLDQIDEATRRATELIRQLLAFERHGDPEPVTISVSAELVQLAALLRPTFRRSVAIEVMTTTEADLVKFDRSRLDQIFVNLAFNARDAMPDGGVITYTVADDTLDPATAGALGIEPGPYVVVTVADDGTGIDPAIIDRIFERHVTTKSPDQGGGLGLATVLGVITQAGGAVTVDRDRVTGTEFTLFFRRATGEHAGCSKAIAPAGHA